MFFYIALALLTLLLYKLLSSYLALQRNIAIAKASGIPYLTLPVSVLGVIWAQVCTNIIYPALEDLPYFKDTLWVRFLDVNNSWSFLTKYSSQLGEHYLLVSPTRFFYVSGNAEANSQIAARRIEFEKPIEDYVIVNHFGRHVLSSEGQDWKRQRKIIAPGFSEKSNAFVWEESLRQAQSMFTYWSKLEGNSIEEMNIGNTQRDTSNLALHVICGAGLGLPQLWPHEDESTLGNRRVTGFNTTKLTGNHKMDFKDSLRKTMGIEIVWLTMLPGWLIRMSPFKIHKTLLAAYEECQQYFRELFEYKRRIKKREDDDESEGTMDLMGPLVKASENAEAATYSTKDGKGIPDGVLTAEEIMGNTFVFVFAGHETSAGTLHYALISLAMHLTVQAHLQSDIDSIVGSRDPSSWSYAIDLRNLYNSMVGAVLNETLRLTPPVLRSPKVNRGGPKQLTVDGKTVTIPGHNTYIHLDMILTGYNPRHFPTSPSKISPGTTDIEEFVPERWLTTPNNSKPNGRDAATTATPNASAAAGIDGLENASFEASGTLFRPAKGAFIPFADGARACPGRRFVQVEISAVLSVIFQRYSVELDVRAFASDAQVERMTADEKRAVYGKAKERAHRLVRGAVSTISLKMEGEPVPLRFVRRGKERFAGLGI